MPRTTLIRKQVTPIGSIQPFGGGTVPAGWMLCNGDPISRDTYSDLFLAIGTAWGIGDGSLTFNLPNLLGKFLRGTDEAAGVDPDSGSRTATNGGNSGDNVGSVQDDSIQGHRHAELTTSRMISDLYAVGDDTFDGYSSAVTAQDAGYHGSPIGDPSDDTVNGAPKTSSETRPKNAAVKYMIKVG